MAWAKWILGGLGWAAAGPIGAVIGFVVGSSLDKAIKETIIETNNQQTTTQRKHYTTESDFLISLLVLTAAVMKSDGKVQKIELDYVKRFLVRQFGTNKAKDLLIALRDILKKEYSVRDVASQIKYNTSYQTRLELLHYLYELSFADGFPNTVEQELLTDIANNLGISQKDYQTIREIFMPERIKNPYTILQIPENATDEEVKKAYRRLAVKHHPDKVSHLGDEVKKDAEAKFQEINNAYQMIKRERGMK